MERDVSDEASPSTTDESAPPLRRPEIDWLRAIAVLLLVPAHAALIFGHGYYINPEDYYRPMGYVFHALMPWHMPILFVLAGMATQFSLRRRSPGSYVWERTKRLIVPLLFGTFMLMPPQVYWQRLSEGQFAGSYLEFYPHFFESLGPVGNFTYGPMWFIAYLFVFSLVALPLFVKLKGERGQRVIGRLAGLCRHRGGIFLLAIAPAISESLLHARFPWNWIVFNDWSMFTWHLLWFILGYVICSDDRFWRAIERDGPIALALALVMMALWLGRHAMEMWVWPHQTAAWIQLMVANAFRTWFCVLAILWIGTKFLRFSNWLLPYVREASYPFYVLHQTVMIGIGYSLAFWDLHVLIRFGLLMAGTFVGTILVYEICVRRFRVVRFLMGLRLGSRVDDSQASPRHVPPSG